jgi:hypothetical protein
MQSRLAENKMKVCLLILAPVIALSVFLVYRVFDSAVTIDHLQMQAISNKQAAQEMLSLLNRIMMGRSVAEVQELMQGLVEPELLKVRENDIEAGHLSFQIRNGKCSNVSLIE